jgi:hypothetical protein
VAVKRKITGFEDLCPVSFADDNKKWLLQGIFIMIG